MLTENQIQARKKWVEYLRSGRFQQGRNYLHRPGDSGFEDTYCCLGVAAVCYKENGGDLEVKEVDGQITYDKESCHLPRPVYEWLGIYEDGSLKRSFCDHHSLEEVNDSGAFNFETIAKIIESGRVMELV